MARVCDNAPTVITEPAFELFGTSHVVALALIGGVSVGLSLWARSWPADRVQRVAGLLALALVVYRTGYIPYVTWIWGDPWQTTLPFHICGLLFYILAYAVWKRDQLAFEVAYFWGMGGSLQALLTPEMDRPFPHPAFLSHFGGHGVLVVVILYAVIAMGLRPVPASILRALAATVAYAAVLLPLNLLLGTNYMFLLTKPASASLLDFLGPWPWYILAAVGVALVSYAVWYLPFLFVDLARRRAVVTAGRG